MLGCTSRYGIYLAVGTEGFKHATKEVLEQSLEAAFGGDRPEYLRGRLVPGSVSSACVSHAHCPVLVVHSPQIEAGDSNLAGGDASPVMCAAVVPFGMAAAAFSGQFVQPLH